MTGKELTVPDWLKDKIEQGTVKADAEKVISTVESVPRISLKARKFNFIENGEVIAKVNDRIHVVIVGVQPESGMAKTFYEGEYQPGDSSPPDCSSFDGVRPDSWISAPQSENCATCPNNKWGSAKAMSGGKAKACRDSKRLIVVNAKNIESGTTYILNVTVSSLKNLSDFGKGLAKQGIPLEAVITTVSMDEDSDFSKLVFTAAGVLNEEQGVLAITRSQAKAWESDLPAIEHKPEVSEPAPSAPAQSQSEASAPAPETAAAAKTEDEEELKELLGSW